MSETPQPPDAPAPGSPESPEAKPSAADVELFDGLAPTPIAVQPGAAEAQDVPPADSRINDVAKAETMAYAEDEFRTRAVENRDAERIPPELTEKQDRLLNMGRQLNAKEPLPRKQRKILRGEWGDLSEEVNTDAARDFERRESADKATSEQFEADFSGQNELTRNFAGRSAETRSQFYDWQASRIGDWAGALHDHPLSEDFAKAHPDVEITPKGMVLMEDEAQTLQRRLESYDIRSHGADSQVNIGSEVRGMLEHSNEHRRIENRGSTTVEAITELLDKADQAKADKWKEITGKLSEAASEADRFYLELVEEVELTPLRNRLAMTRNLLSDVRRAVGLDEPLPVGDGETGEAEPETPSE